MTNYDDLKDWMRVYPDIPIEELTMEELQDEISAHRWVRLRIRSCAKHMSMRVEWLKNNKPIVPREVYYKQYQNGEISYKEFRATAIQSGNRKKYHREAQAQVKIGMDYFDHETAIVTMLEERLDTLKHEKRLMQKSAEKRKSEYRQRTAAPGRNPRKNLTARNPKPWRPTAETIPKPRVVLPQPKWDEIRTTTRSATRAMKRQQPIVNWNPDKLMKIAYDRGYQTKLITYAVIAQEFRCSVSVAKAYIMSGKMSWGQCILLASLFEMTPVEFCDTFLNGVFQEVVDGKWVAVVEDKEALLALSPYRQNMPSSEAVDDDEEGDIGPESDESEENE